MRYIATKNFEILQGIIPVPQLSDTIDSIGNMDHVCNFCRALKYKNEIAIYDMYCRKGNIKEPFFQSPQM